MADVDESATVWPAGIYQIETTDPVLGGAVGIANKQAIDLATRTAIQRRLAVGTCWITLDQNENHALTRDEAMHSIFRIVGTGIGPTGFTSGTITFPALLAGDIIRDRVVTVINETTGTISILSNDDQNADGIEVDIASDKMARILLDPNGPCLLGAAGDISIRYGNVTGISPNSAPHASPTLMTIYGVGFLGATHVNVVTDVTIASYPITVFSDTDIQWTLDPAAVGGSGGGAPGQIFAIYVMRGTHQLGGVAEVSIV